MLLTAKEEGLGSGANSREMTYRVWFTPPSFSSPPSQPGHVGVDILQDPPGISISQELAYGPEEGEEDKCG